MKDLRIDKTMVTELQDREFLFSRIPFYYKGIKFIVVRINSILFYIQLLKVSSLCTHVILKVDHHASQQLSFKQLSESKHLFHASGIVHANGTKIQGF